MGDDAPCSGYGIGVGRCEEVTAYPENLRMLANAHELRVVDARTMALGPWEDAACKSITGSPAATSLMPAETFDVTEFGVAMG